MLTPRDIHEADFKRVWKGYSPEEVDEFLQRVVVEYEKVYKENLELREKVEALEQRLAKYASAEMQIAMTLEAAKEAAADAKAAAAKEAEATLARARAQANEITARAARVAGDKAQALLLARYNLERFRASAGSALKAFLAEMERWEIEIPDELEKEMIFIDPPVPLAVEAAGSDPVDEDGEEQEAEAKAEAEEPDKLP